MVTTSAATRHLAASAVVALLLGACGGERGSAADTAVPRALDDRPAAAAPDTLAADTAAATGAPAGADSGACPMVGAWRQCSVVERLERAGFGPMLVEGEARQPSLAIPGSVYRLGSAELQLYLYADSAGAARQAASVDAAEAEPADARGIRRAPLVIHSQNLVALLFDNNDRLRERVQLALTAGLPRG